MTQRNYEFTEDAIRILDAIKETKKHKLNEFVSQAVILYGLDELGEDAPQLEESYEEETKKRLKKIESSILAIRFELLELKQPEIVKQALEGLEKLGIEKASKEARRLIKKGMKNGSLPKLEKDEWKALIEGNS